MIIRKETKTMNAKFTKREKLDALINGLGTGNWTIDKDILVAFCEAEKAIIEKKAAKAKEKSADDELLTAVEAALTADLASIADITEIVGGDATVSKVQYRLNKLAADGKAVKGEITVPASDGKKGRKIVGYSRA
jgi:hypothetical protein